MLKVGLTGGIGAGKSIIIKIFEILNIPVYIADIEAKRLIDTDCRIKKALTHVFGEDIYINDSINKAKLASIIFNDKKSLKLVNSIVHPVLRLDFEEWCLLNSKAPYVIQESAIIFESGAQVLFDKIICVSANMDCRISRAMKRDNATKEKVIERINNQMSDVEKIQKSDYVIYNSDSDMLIKQVLELDSYLKKK